MIHFINRHPIDVVKTRLQVSGTGGGTRNYKALGIAGTVRVIAVEEGPTAFWKGSIHFKNSFDFLYLKYLCLLLCQFLK